jgi:hypothetical protein
MIRVIFKRMDSLSVSIRQIRVLLRKRGELHHYQAFGIGIDQFFGIQVSLNENGSL